MNEELHISESQQGALEHYSYSEHNSETRADDTQNYISEYNSPEFQSYEESGSPRRLPRHSAVLRNNRNRLGRLLGMLAAIAGPAIAVILVLTTTVFVDVSGYRSFPERLEIDLNLYSSSDRTEFSATLSDRNGAQVGSAVIDRENPALTFEGLTPGQIYYLDVSADGEIRLSLNYLLPEAETEEPQFVPAEISSLSCSSGLTSVRAVFSVVNPAENAITAKLDGEDFGFETDGERITADITGLEENSSHTLEFYDEDGSLILSYPFSTRKRAKAAVSLLSENVGVDSVSLEFEITNPDGNEISVYYDGEEYAASVTENPYTATFNGLTIGEEHEIEFRDQDGSVIMTHSFSARERKPANVVITGLAGGFSTVTVSLEVDNPDNNQLELRINGQEAEIDFEAEEPYAVITGLDPRTDYTVSVTDLSRGEELVSQSVATSTSLTWSQDRSGNTTFTLTDEFIAEHPGVSLTLTDSLGVNIPVTSLSDSKGFKATAEKLIYTDTYSVELTLPDGSSADSLSAGLTLKARPVFELKFFDNQPATLKEAKSDEYHTSYTSDSRLGFRLKSGYLPVQEPDYGAVTDKKYTWAAVIVKNSSGKAKSVCVGYYGETDIISKSSEYRGFYGGSTLDDADGMLPKGSYTAAYYLLDGYTVTQMEDLIWGTGTTEPTPEQIADPFLKKGRKISSDVSFTVKNPTPMAWGSLYKYSDTVDLGNGSYSFYFEYSFSGMDTGFTGYIALVSASDTSIALNDPIIIGSDEIFGERVTRYTVQASGPVYIILYQKELKPANYLCVIYDDLS